MQVRALRAHSNAYGSTFQKAVNDTYSIPDAAAAPLIAAGVVVQIDAPPPPEAALTGTATADGTFGPFTPIIGRQIFVTISGIWEGTVAVYRSLDDGETLTGLTREGGTAWGAWKDGIPVGMYHVGDPFTLSCNEPLPWIETEAGATYWIVADITSGTLSYRIAQ